MDLNNPENRLALSCLILLESELLVGTISSFNKVQVYGQFQPFIVTIGTKQYF